MQNILPFLFSFLSFLLGYSFRSIVISSTEEKKSLNLKLLLETKRGVIFDVASGLLTGFLTYYISNKVLFESNLPIIDKILLLLIIGVVLYALIFLSVFDIKYFEIPDIFSLFIFIILLVVNVVLFIISNQPIEIWNGNFYIPGSNILAALLGGGFIFLIVILTKGKGMGVGDIRIAAILGLVLGMEKLLAGFYLTILSASLVGIIYSIKLKKFHGVQIPFVPFIVFGTIMAFLFSTELSNWFLGFYGV